MDQMNCYVEYAKSSIINLSSTTLMDTLWQSITSQEWPQSGYHILIDRTAVEMRRKR